MKTSGLKQMAWLGMLTVLVTLSVVSLLPLIETNAWWIRMLDFSRLQVLVALVVLLAIFLFFRPRGTLSWGMVLLAVAAIAYHGYKLVPYLSFREELAIPIAECPEGSRLRVLVANVRRGHESAEELFQIVAQADPDLFLAVETDQWWDQRLSELQPVFAEQVQQVAGARAYFGMHLFSKYPLVDPAVLFPVNNRVPAIVTAIRLPDGGMMSFYGLHPRPPQLLKDSTVRDAQLLIAGLAAREAEGAMILAGDFNAVPWERIFRRTMRIGGLLDPRVGRGYIPTYDAHSWLFAWPLDHIIFTDEVGLLEFERLPEFGSDHYPVLADLCHIPALADEQDAPAIEPDDLEEAETSIEAALEITETQPGQL